jgi:hypothetical protein
MIYVLNSDTLFRIFTHLSIGGGGVESLQDGGRTFNFVFAIRSYLFLQTNVGSGPDINIFINLLEVNRL